jgi:hypothetical protein
MFKTVTDFDDLNRDAWKNNFHLYNTKDGDSKPKAM